ncbi:MAG: NUDIX hydrolase [Chloroflexota bacterium]|nr:MAG: NUDIX hydrolase [Chloroflexota bacterium]
MLTVKAQRDCNFSTCPGKMALPSCLSTDSDWSVNHDCDSPFSVRYSCGEFRLSDECDMSLQTLTAALQHLLGTVNSPSEVPSAYQSALRDLFTGIGVLSQDGQTFSTPTARFFVQSLLRCLEEGALTASAWQGTPESFCDGLGAALTQTLEEHRLGCSAQPQPLRIVQTAVAIIKAQRNGEDVYLMQYDAAARQFQLLGGKREPSDESTAAALIRELREELGMAHLTPERDFKLYPLVEGVREMSVSESTHVLSAYDHSFYQLLQVRFRLPEDEVTRWLTMHELIHGRTHDGRKVSRLLVNYLAEILPTLRHSLDETLE